MNKCIDEESLFAAALERANPAERQAFLDRACSGDVALRQRLDRLLAADERTRGILESTPDGRTIDPSGSPPPLAAERTFAGRFALCQKLGEGGMGEVWAADQLEPLRRRVALKVVRPGFDSGRMLARFEQERQALALMDHPNIAKVLDAGLAEGCPYFVMELIEGVPLTKFCDEHRLVPNDRLALFVQVCQAVQHAHQKGIIHRDLKPDNVLVACRDGVPVPKVIDFGVAKATGPRLTGQGTPTEVGTLVGTLEYMSPEQAEPNNLDIDTRSDVYSLGVLLYELLTGSTPFTRKDPSTGGMLETLRVIREDEPTRPSAKLSTAEGLPTLAVNRGMEPAKLTRLVRGELDWIVMKALEKDRNRRYESANAVARDVQRYLADEPVLACPPSAGYRLWKFARRNRGALVGAALLGALLLVAAAGFGWVARDRASQRSRNAEAVVVLLGQCEEALRADRTDRAAVALEAAERRAADGGAEGLSGRLAGCRADLELLRALDAADTFRWTWARGAFPDPGAVVAQWRVALTNFGVSLDEDHAEEAAQRVNGSRARDRVLVALDLWLAARQPVGGRQGVRAILRRADPDPYRDAVRDAVAAREFPRFAALAGQPEALDQPARFAVVLGQLHGVPAERGRAVLKSALRARPGNLYLLMALGESYPINQPKAAGESVRWFQAAVAAHPGNVAALNNLGVALFDQGDLDGALAAHRDAIQADPHFALGHHNLGGVLQRKGDRDGAIAAYRDAIRIQPEYLEARFKLGAALLEKRDLHGAIACFEEAARLHPTDARTHGNLGVVLQANRDWDRALAAYREAVRLDPGFSDAHSNLAALLATGPGRVRDGKRAVEHATRACELTAWKNPRYFATLAAAHAEVGDFARAIEFQKKALSFPDYAKQSGKAAQERLTLFGRKQPYRDPRLAPHEHGTPAPEVRPKD